MVLRIAIVEDDAATRKQLADYIGQYAAETDLCIEICTFTDGEELLVHPLEKVDLVLLDIQMAHLGGMEAAQRLRQLSCDVPVIFVTSLAQYAVQGYQVDAIDFLVKPVSYPVLKNALNHYKKRCVRQTPQYLTLRGREGVLRLPSQELVYAEVFKHQVLIHRRNGKDFSYSGTLTALEKELPQGEFFRCHSAYLVNLAYVERTIADAVVAAGCTLPLSKHRRKEFLTALAAYWGRCL